jgi:hypothetical protein
MEADDLGLDLDLGRGMGQLRREVSTGWWRLTVAVEDERSWVGHLMEEGLLMDSGRPWQILVGCREEMSTVWQGSWEVGPGPDCCSCWKLDMGQIAVAAGC